MAGLKIFVSSTCFDLSILRSELRNFIASLGYEPVMSDYADVLYNPRQHTHSSCIDEITNCDMVVLIIGPRFGGKSVPEALDKVDFAALQHISDCDVPVSREIPVSITQLEVLKAIENHIPVYTFIEKKVYYGHEVYEKNKNHPELLEKMVFPGLEKQETAKYIFGFIDFIRLKATGNFIFQFERVQDIEDILKKQWSSYFQRLLYEERHNNAEQKRIDLLSEQFEDLKTAILSSIENVDQREIARNIVRYRRLADLLLGMRIPLSYLCTTEDSFMEMLQANDIVDILDARECGLMHDRPIASRSFLLKRDGTFYETRFSLDAFSDFANDWETFRSLKPKEREIILDTLKEISRPVMWFRYHKQTLDAYLSQKAVPERMKMAD